MISYTEIKKELKKELAEISSKLSTTQPTADEIVFEIKFSDIGSDNKLEKHFEKMSSQLKSTPGRYLYIIEGNSRITTSKVQDQYSSAKKKYPHLAFARVNKQDSNCSSVLYVGSSTKLHSRLKQHMGICPNRTYALRMNKWAKKFKGTFKVRCICFDKSIDVRVLQAIEDAYSRSLKPLFGRIGSL